MACAEDKNRDLVLAEGDGIGSICLCGCGTIHVSVGAVTMRLAPEAFCQMLVMCQRAANTLFYQEGAIGSMEIASVSTPMQ